MTDPKSEPSELTDEQIDEIILSAPTLGYALLCGVPDQTVRAGEFKKAVRALSRVIAAALTPAPAQPEPPTAAGVEPVAPALPGRFDKAGGASTEPLEEREGFEPSEPCGSPDFEPDERTWLGWLS